MTSENFIFNRLFAASLCCGCAPMSASAQFENFNSLEYYKHMRYGHWTPFRPVKTSKIAYQSQFTCDKSRCFDSQSVWNRNFDQSHLIARSISACSPYVSIDGAQSRFPIFNLPKMINSNTIHGTIYILASNAMRFYQKANSYYVNNE